MHRLILTLAAFAVVIGLAPAAGAQSTVPRYDPDRWCKQVASSVGGFSDTIMRGCLDGEQEAYNDLKETWQNVPAKTKKWCNQLAKSTGGGSYELLKGCIESETEAADENSKSEFKW